MYLARLVVQYTQIAKFLNAKSADDREPKCNSETQLSDGVSAPHVYACVEYLLEELIIQYTQIAKFLDAKSADNREPKCKSETQSSDGVSAPHVDYLLEGLTLSLHIQQISKTLMMNQYRTTHNILKTI